MDIVRVDDLNRGRSHPRTHARSADQACIRDFVERGGPRHLHAAGALDPLEAAPPRTESPKLQKLAPSVERPRVESAAATVKRPARLIETRQSPSFRLAPVAVTGPNWPVDSVRGEVLAMVTIKVAIAKCLLTAKGWPVAGKAADWLTSPSLHRGAKRGPIGPSGWPVRFACHQPTRGLPI